MEEETVNFEDFIKIDLRIGTVIEAEKVEGSNKLLKLKVDLGKELGIKQVLSGIAKQYEPEDLLNKQVVMVVNLASRAIMGMESQGMILAGGEEEISLLSLDKKLENGAKVH